MDPIDEDRFRTIVEFLSHNPRVSQSREESAERHYLDGFADYNYNRFYVEAWNLAIKVPTTPKWATALSKLFHRLHRPFDCLSDIPAILDRWTPENEDEYGPYREVREAICRAFVKPTLGELHHADAARRTAFIQKFDPDSPEFRELDWGEISKADPHWEYAAGRNMNIWASSSARRKYRAQLWADSKRNSDITSIGFFDEEAERIRKIHPEWFIEHVDVETDNPPEPDRFELLQDEVRNIFEEIAVVQNRLTFVIVVFVVGLLITYWLQKI